ncbi:MAG: LapA family protein [Tissierellales bacterium]|nr:LapA family protein [Tissierellales bacterium]MBN2827901.1 LapA family protein [Tissierellales bacterium]
MQINFILLLIVSILISIFAIQNGDTVSIDLFFFKQEMSQALVILASVGLGALTAVILSAFGKIKRFRTIKSLNKKIKLLESEATTQTVKLEQLLAEKEGLAKDVEELLKENQELLSVKEENSTPESQEPIA